MQIIISEFKQQFTEAKLDVAQSTPTAHSLSVTTVMLLRPSADFFGEFGDLTE
jgi:hypothetical protein